MAKLYFKYGVMGSSKSANLLMTKYNYEQKNKKVLLLKPKIDNRDGITKIKSRIGLETEALFSDFMYEYDFKNNINSYDVIIVDESQFLNEEDIIYLHKIATFNDIPVICYGLKTDFLIKTFEGSKTLLEHAESIQEIKTVCKCGKKATVNARIDNDNNIITDGDSIELGSDDKYESMCYKCYIEKIKRQKEKAN